MPFHFTGEPGTGEKPCMKAAAKGVASGLSGVGRQERPASCLPIVIWYKAIEARWRSVFAKLRQVLSGKRRCGTVERSIFDEFPSHV